MSLKFCKTTLIIIGFSALGWARNDIGEYSIPQAVNSPEFQSRIGHKFKFYFGDQAHPKPKASLGEARVNKKTSAFAKSDTAACHLAFLNAALALKAKAYKMGGNAVIGVWSNYKNNRMDNDSIYECGAGAMAAGAALVGEVVVIDDSAATAVSVPTNPTPAAP